MRMTGSLVRGVMGVLLLLGAGRVVSGASSEQRVMGPYLSRIGTAAPTVVVHTDPACGVTFSSDGRVVESKMQSHHYFPLSSVAGDVAYTVKAGDLPLAEGLARLGTDHTGGLTFAIIGDAQNSTSSERRAKVLAALVAHQPAFIIHTGDMLVGKPDAGNVFGDEWRLNFFDPMPDYQRTVPFLPVLGNHDDMTEGQRASFQTVFPGMPENGCYSFSTGGTAFFFMDILNQVREFVDKGHRQWLAEEVGKYPDARWKVAVFHVSPWSGGHRGEREWTVGGREELLAALQQAGVDLVFCGHDHNYQRIRPLVRKGVAAGPVQIVITGMAGSNAYDATEKAYTAMVVNRRDHYCLVKVTAESIHVQAIAADGEVIDRFEIPASRNCEPVFEVEDGSD